MTAVLAQPLLCQHCTKIDFPKLYKTIQHDSILPPRKLRTIIEADKHPGLRSPVALRQSAEACPCCAFLYRELQNTIRRAYKSSGIETLSDELPEDLKHAELFLRVEPSRGRLQSSLPVEFRKRLHLKFVDEDLDYEVCMRIATAREAVGEPSRGNPNFHCRVVKDDLNPGTVRDIIQSWQHQCTESHKECATGVTDTLPDRVLEIGTERVPSLRLRETTNEGAPYVALSYCWGTIGQTMTLDENYEAFKIGIDETQLPATTKDAIAVTRALGIRYLWIDAFCIIQGNAEDWKAQSVKMASVYGNAHLTLITSRATGVHEGFLHSRHSTTLPMGTVSEDGEERQIYLVPETEKEADIINEIGDTPIGRRGWCLQERLVSPRKVHFTNQQMFWECKERYYFETGIVSLVPRGLMNAAVVNHSQSNFIGVGAWSDMLDLFTACKLTDMADRLPAISAIAEHFVAELGKKESRGTTEYIAGHWRENFVESLMWRTVDNSSSRYLKRYVGPSWSWASAPSGVKFENWGHDDGNGTWTNLEYHIQQDGSGPFGRVQGGWLSMTVPLLEVRLEPTGQENGWYELAYNRKSRLWTTAETRRRKFGSGVYLDESVDNNPAFLYAAVLYNGHRDIVGPGVYEGFLWSGILLQERQGTSEFIRVGTFLNCELEATHDASTSENFDLQSKAQLVKVY